MKLADLFMVFDVESAGLHGEGFAVGWVVIDRAGKEIAEGRASVYLAELWNLGGDDEGKAWVADNVPDSVWESAAYHDSAYVRESFWCAWQEWKSKGAVLVADCAWPVEARFLAACIDGNPMHRRWEGPYPLHELASIRMAAGLDPLGTNDRLPSELPAHDPLADARQSARLLIEALGILDGQQADAHSVPYWCADFGTPLSYRVPDFRAPA